MERVGELGRKRGRKGADPLETENAELRRRAQRAEAELAKCSERSRRSISSLKGSSLEGAFARR